MAKEGINPEKAKKTAALMSFANLLASPLYPRLGVTASFTIITAALFSLHEIGRNTKPGSHTVFGIFSTKEKNAKKDVQDAAENIVEGGAKLFDDFFPGTNNSKP